MATISKSKPPSGDQKALMILSHILALFSGFIGPLIILLASEDEEVKKHAKMNLNWVFSFMIYFFAGYILAIIFGILSFIIIGIPFLILTIICLITVGVLSFVFCIMAAVKASRGELWKYPLSIPFFKI